MKQNNLESQLEAFNLVKPSSRYLDKANEVFAMRKKQRKLLIWNVSLAFSLVVSLAFNLLKVNDINHVSTDEIKKVASNEQKKGVKYSIEYGMSAPGMTKSNVMQIWENNK